MRVLSAQNNQPRSNKVELSASAPHNKYAMFVLSQIADLGNESKSQLPWSHKELKPSIREIEKSLAANIV